MKVAIVGVGKMGSAFAKGLLRSGTASPPELVLVESDPTRRRALADEFGGCTVVDSVGTRDTTASWEVALLAVKPQDLAPLLAQLSESLDPRVLVLSIAAGVRISSIERRLGPPFRVIRAMPNLGATVGAGVSAFAVSRHVSEDDKALARSVLEAIGPTMEVAEAKLDAVTAVSGSGPAYVFLLAEAMDEAARRLGLGAKEAEILVAHTVLGSGLLLVEEGPGRPGGRTAAEWRSAVTSKGGTTEAALSVLGERRFKEAVIAAVEAAARRAEELDTFA